MLTISSGYDMRSSRKCWKGEMPSIVLLSFLTTWVKMDSVMANSPIVIVNNNHNNNAGGGLLSGPHFIFNNGTSSSGGSVNDGSLLDPNPDLGPVFADAELTTAPAATVNSNAGSIFALDDPVNTSLVADPFSSLFFTDQQIPVLLMHSNNSTTQSSPPLLPTHAPPLRHLPVHYAPLLKNSSSSSSSSTSSPSDPSSAAGSEHKLRWIDYRSRPSPAFPPRVPSMPGIPSGFRNPPSSTPLPSTPSHPANPHVNPQLVHAFGPSSTNPVGFAGSVPPAPASFPASNMNQDRKRPMPNITRVEHIAAECSDDYMKVTIHYNGTFTGLVYSSGYVHDPNCIYINGTGRNHYEFFIRLNQCGTLGRQEMYHPKRPGEVRRRDQVMWNTLSIQYNPMIEEEWDEHYRVTCEYGSDFWKTVTFPAVNVEVNTGSPVVFTINPPQCQMEVRRGFGTAGSRTSGPVTVGDPLTLLIHMKSEKAGFDILVKNCIAHNGAQQRLQLIDPNGCVTNEKLISPFRGTYNSDDGHQVSLYAYLKAFRFTGSPALYLECDIHMCHNKCPPQRCYWRNLSKRSVRSVEDAPSNDTSLEKPVISESISLFQALEVRHEPEETERMKSQEYSKQVGLNSSSTLCFRPDGVAIFGLVIAFLLIAATTVSLSSFLKMRRIRRMYEMQNEGSLYKNALSYENLCYTNHINRRRF